MKRRTFTKNLAAGAVLWPLGSAAAAPAASRKKIRPHRLKRGDTVGLVTPGSYLDDEGLQKAVTNLEGLGFHVKLSANIRAERGFTAGTDGERLADLHAMFADPQVSAVWCARGGYGCSRLLPGLDFDLIKKHPKVLIGYSDITALLQAIHLRTGLVCFHGPVGASEFTDYTRSQVTAMLLEGAAPFTIQPAAANGEAPEEAFQPLVISEGQARGPLAGGNLSLLAAMAGTPFDLDVRGKLLFIEDVGEKPYRIDRMLTQLRQSSKLQEAAGIALGIWADCEADPEDRSLTLRQTLADRLGDLGIPVAYGLSFGHIDNQCTLPVGITAELDTNNLTITLQEAAVE